MHIPVFVKERLRPDGVPGQVRDNAELLTRVVELHQDPPRARGDAGPYLLEELGLVLVRVARDALEVDSRVSILDLAGLARQPGGIRPHLVEGRADVPVLIHGLDELLDVRPLHLVVVSVLEDQLEDALRLLLPVLVEVALSLDHVLPAVRGVQGLQGLVLERVLLLVVAGPGGLLFLVVVRVRSATPLTLRLQHLRRRLQPHPLRIREEGDGKLLRGADVQGSPPAGGTGVPLDYVADDVADLLDLSLALDIELLDALHVDMDPVALHLANDVAERLLEVVDPEVALRELLAED
ncbi:MAG: hypothetical protein BWY99_02542 [Synergistetes bacterium ADurb.BinA166]|nr:MAG: hypothetical protein BWY99_02542 [Synergistetes bacterium ADurb.BinA166]